MRLTIAKRQEFAYVCPLEPHRGRNSLVHGLPQDPVKNAAVQEISIGHLQFAFVLTYYIWVIVLDKVVIWFYFILVEKHHENESVKL